VLTVHELAVSHRDCTALREVRTLRGNYEACMFYLRFIILSLGIDSQAESRTFSNSGLLLDSVLTGCACFESKVSSLGRGVSVFLPWKFPVCMGRQAVNRLRLAVVFPFSPHVHPNA
jgi:hypothetical protein